ncbi:MAG: ATP-binding protein, partial [Ghiorsea sp.]|nr:ATP-binding protein [Ghiorsea sp.]
YDHEGSLVGMVLIGRPIGELRKAYNDLHETHTELKQAQAQLVQSEKMASLGRLVAGVAHELNNPISFVHSNMFALKKYGYRLREYIEALHGQLGDELDDDLRKKLKIDRILDDIPSLVDGGLEGTMRVSTIVQDLRRFSSSHREEKTMFDVLDVVSNAAKWVTQTSKIQANLSIEGEHLRINNYEGFVHQVLVNLIQNSLDAMEQKDVPRIDVRCYQQGKEVVIIVKDYGIGISKQDKLKIFDPFFTTKDAGKGTGLGLYVSYGLIVEQCEGRLTADNHVDGGAVFTIALPYEAAQT